MKNKLRIGIFTHNYPRTSKERKDAGIFIHDFAHELNKYAQVLVFCPDFGGRKEKYSKVPVTWFKWDEKNKKFGEWKLFNPISIYMFLKLMFIGQREAIDFVKRQKIDHVLACWSVPSSIFALIVKVRMKVGYSSWSLGSDVNKYLKYPVLSQIIKLSLNGADVRFANSYSLIRKIESSIKKTCFFLPAITKFSQPKEKLRFKDNRFHFLFVGRLEKVKGPDILLKAAKILSKTKSNFVIDILGDGTLLIELKTMSEDFQDKINFHGWADEKKVSEFMSKSDCLVIPSRSESLPLVMFEAANRKLPIIATDVGDCKRIINKYRVGISVKKEDHRELSKALEKVLLRKIKVDNKGFDDIVKDFSQQNAVRTFLSKIKSNNVK